MYVLNALAPKSAEIRGIWEFILGSEPEAETEEEMETWEFLDDLLRIEEEKGFAMALSTMPHQLQLATKVEIPPEAPGRLAQPREFTVLPEDRLLRTRGAKAYKEREELREVGEHGSEEG